jgi:hypothetical protein
MKHVFVAILSAASLSSHGVAQHPVSHPITEKIEWTWADRPEAPDRKLPNVLLLGDSISRAYYPATSKALQGVANVYLFATSACVADPRYTGQLRGYMAMVGVPFRVIHFNNGMHGWKYTEQQYAASLPAIVTALHALQPGAKLVWANTTPIRSENDGATNERIDQRNQDSDRLMQRLGIAIDDQHTLMQTHADLHQDNVHWNEQGSEIQSLQVSESIRRQLIAK